MWKSSSEVVRLFTWRWNSSIAEWIPGFDTKLQQSWFSISGFTLKLSKNNWVKVAKVCEQMSQYFGVCAFGNEHLRFKLSPRTSTSHWKSGCIDCASIWSGIIRQTSVSRCQSSRYPYNKWLRTRCVPIDRNVRIEERVSHNSDSPSCVSDSLISFQSLLLLLFGNNVWWRITVTTIRCPFNYVRILN